ncbi:class I SAM-dependent methyltransferase [Ruegeria sp.]|uniref:class I SAM-dependent methyltransferase n=1 Tax=Ruegeria sp. TaxID=1879320 RepID=UPI003B5C23A8
MEDEVVRQTEFHECLWKEETQGSLFELVEGMEAVIDFYKDVLKDPTAGGTVYDIGSGRGNLLAALLRKGYDAFGCEPSTELSTKARTAYNLPGNRLMTTSASNFLAQRKDQQGSVDTVFLWHVIEHFERPMDILWEITQHLAPDGILICQGPMLNPEYVFPAHRFFHSESNITWLARELGLKVVFMNGLSPQRYISFALAKPDHPAPEKETVFLTNPEAAVGSLYFTLSKGLSALAQKT